MQLRYITLVTAAMAFTSVAFSQANDTPFQVRYASNLGIGDSVINITNTGARGEVTPQSGTTPVVTGTICANVFVFSPDEQMISCCSCPVTPNGLVSLSARGDLISNTLTPASPGSIVIKLLATVPATNTASGCATSSFQPLAGVTLANGMLAWGTTLHQGVNAPAPSPAGTATYGVTETRFSNATLSASELARLFNTCLFINQVGSTFGICRSCRLGGLGAARQ